MEIKLVVPDNTNGSNAILGLGVDNKMYVWNYVDADWDLLQHKDEE